MPPIDTRKVQRRKVRLTGLDDVLAEAERLAQAEREGRLVRLGNWSLGQMFGHLASWMEYAYDGYPPAMAPPLVVRWVIRLMRRRILSGPMPQGYRVPGIKGGTFGIEEMSTNEGLSRLHRAVARMNIEPARFHSPALGPLSEAERIRLHIGHAELHMGFFDEAG